MKFREKTKDCRLFVKTRASFGETIDERELDRFARVYLRGFFKPQQIKRNAVVYTGPVGISLYERLKNPVTKRDFLFILEQIVVAVQKLQANHLPCRNLVLDIHHVYINEVTKEVQFIYLPVADRQGEADLVDFIESVVYSVHPADENDRDFISRFTYFFKALDPFDIQKLEKFVAREDRSVVNIIKKQNSGQSGYMTDKRQHYYDHYDSREEAFDDDPTGLLSEEEDVEPYDEEATGLLRDEEATGLLCEEEDGTALLAPEKDKEHFPTLIRVSTEECICINKPVFRLGKERSYVDYFVANNPAVSRSHADIITRGNAYFVVDLNSKNHTYINNREIPVQCETEIYNGDRLRLGDEEFIFNE